MKKGQVVFIHGGDSFATNEAFYESLRKMEYEPHPEPYKRWRYWLQTELEADDHEWLFMNMPNKLNADYEAWRIWFEKVVPFITSDTPTHVIGYSLGACFLLRYLSENEAPFIIDKLHLVAPTLDDGQLGSFVCNETLLHAISEQIGEVKIYHSKDDPFCRYSDSTKLTDLIPDSHLHTFTDRSHFFQPEFPELLTEIIKP